MTINETILAIRAKADAAELVKEWANCAEADVDAEGDIWIANPQTGHWLSDERKAEFVEWCESR